MISRRPNSVQFMTLKTNHLMTEEKKAFLSRTYKLEFSFVISKEASAVANVCLSACLLYEIFYPMTDYENVGETISCLLQMGSFVLTIYVYHTGHELPVVVCLGT